MKRAFVLVPVFGAVSMLSWLGCGGGTTTGDFAPVMTDGGGGDGTEGGSGTSGGAGTSMGSAGSANTSDSGPSFDPGTIGGLVGGGSDGSAPIGTGDAGIGGGIITPEVVDGCNSLCTKEAAAQCPKQGTVGDCIVGCRLILNNANCKAQSTALFACEKNSTATCDNQGKATLTTCGLEQLSAATCFLTNATDPSLTGPCTSYCAGVAAAKCPNDDPSGCATGCPVIGNFIPACNMHWQNYVKCASTKTLTCGDDGKAGAPACVLQAAAYFLCVTAGVTNTGDAGQ